ncbi:hypothetical protein M9458_053365 [Cirrhinus mrigala]|uniref:Uncharacterized protein n=1 Tax=Cirrhinus mrigala TaxID=683832 RepID=A0ABD0MS13_CIRMR
MVSEQAVSALHAMAILQVYQAKVLKDLHEGVPNPELLQELRSVTDYALRATKVTAQVLRRAMSTMVVQERHLWLNLAEMRDAEKVRFLNTPISQVGLFGNTGEKIAQQFSTVKKQTEAIKHILPWYFTQRRGEPPPSDDPADSESVRPGISRSLCLTRIHSLPVVVRSNQGPPRFRCTGTQLAEGPTQVCISPSEPHCTDHVQSQGGQRTGSSGGPVLAQQNLVLGPCAPIVNSSLVHSSEEGPPLSGEGHNLAPAHRSLEPPPMVPGRDQDDFRDLPPSVSGTANLFKRTQPFRRSEQLFVCFGGQQKGKAVSKQRISHWFVDAIRMLTLPAGSESPLDQGCRCLGSFCECGLFNRHLQSCTLGYT